MVHLARSKIEGLQASSIVQYRPVRSWMNSWNRESNQKLSHMTRSTSLELARGQVYFPVCSLYFCRATQTQKASQTFPDDNFCRWVQCAYTQINTVHMNRNVSMWWSVPWCMMRSTCRHDSSVYWRAFLIEISYCSRNCLSVSFNCSL